MTTSREGGGPPLLDAYFSRTGLRPDAGLRWCRIEQAGEMRMKPDGDWKPFTAVQLYAVSHPSFVWRADFKTITVVDSLVDGDGCLEARFLGILPVVKASGPAASRAQLMRYLSEIAWVPRAIAGNAHLSWRQLASSEVLGELDYRGMHVELRFAFDGHGDIARVEGTRGRMVGQTHVETPWIGVFSDYDTLGDVRIPTRGEVQWVLDSGPFTYWRGRVLSLETS